MVPKADTRNRDCTAGPYTTDTSATFLPVAADFFALSDLCLIEVDGLSRTKDSVVQSGL